MGWSKSNNYMFQFRHRRLPSRWCWSCIWLSRRRIGWKDFGRNGGQLIDRVVEVEFGLNIETDVAVIKPNGIIAAYGSAKSLTPEIPFRAMLFKAVTLDIILIYLLPLEQRLQIIERLNNALSENALSCPVAQIFPLDKAVQAHELVENGARNGAVLIDVRT